jgi:hypothetical protein
MSRSIKIIISAIALAVFGALIWTRLAHGPAEPIANPDWKTFTDEAGIYTFQYPETLSAAYISTVDWPPQVQLVEGPYMCTEAGTPILPAGQTEERMVDDRVYCVTTENEGAAGSMYSLYAYAMDHDGQVVIFTFTLRYPQCGNYDDPKKSACEAEREAFDLDGVMDRIAQTFRFLKT